MTLTVLALSLSSFSAETSARDDRDAIDLARVVQLFSIFFVLISYWSDGVPVSNHIDVGDVGVGRYRGHVGVGDVGVPIFEVMSRGIDREGCPRNAKKLPNITKILPKIAKKWPKYRQNVENRPKITIFLLYWCCIGPPRNLFGLVLVSSRFLAQK